MMRLALPTRLMVWTLFGAVLVSASLTVLVHATSSAYCAILLAFAFWTAAGVDTLLRIEALWTPRYYRLSAAIIFGLPAIVLTAAYSQLPVRKLGESIRAGSIHEFVRGSHSQLDARLTPRSGEELRATRCPLPQGCAR